MRYILIAAIAASSLMPVATQAHGLRHHLWHDRHEVIEEHADLRRAIRYGSPAHIREERREFGAALHDYHQDLTEWRRHHRCTPHWHSCRR